MPRTRWVYCTVIHTAHFFVSLTLFFYSRWRIAFAFSLSDFFHILTNKKYSDSVFITRICIPVSLVFPLNRSHCIVNGDEHGLTGVRALLYTWYACLFLCAYFFWAKFSLEQSMFFFSTIFINDRMQTADWSWNESTFICIRKEVG